MPKGGVSKFGDCGGCNKLIGSNTRKLFKCQGVCKENWHEGCVRKRDIDPEKESWRC